MQEIEGRVYLTNDVASEEGQQHIHSALLELVEQLKMVLQKMLQILFLQK